MESSSTTFPWQHKLFAKSKSRPGLCMINTTYDNNYKSWDKKQLLVQVINQIYLGTYTTVLYSRAFWSTFCIFALITNWSIPSYSMIFQVSEKYHRCPKLQRLWKSEMLERLTALWSKFDWPTNLYKMGFDLHIYQN